MAIQKKDRVLAYLRQCAGEEIDEIAFGELGRAFPDCSERFLRTVVRESGLCLTPVVEGVRQDSFAALERTLRALAREYEKADAVRRKKIRSLVIAAKTHAKWGIRTKPEKAEMVMWLRTWLENPVVFPLWADLRLRQASLE